MTGALVQPRTSPESLGPLRDGAAFSSPLWQVPLRRVAPSDGETPIENISDPTAVAASAEPVDQEIVLEVDHGSDTEPDSVPDSEPASEPDSEPDFDAPTETFHTGLFNAETVHATAEPARRPFPWPPSPWPRNATSPTVRISVADLLGRVDQHEDATFAGVNDEWDNLVGRGASSSPAPNPTTTPVIEPSRSFNARTLVLAAIASLVVLSVGALLGGPMGAVTIAPEAGPASSAAGAHPVSGASVVPAALLAGAPAPVYPASIERLDAPAPAPPAVPAAPVGDAAKSGIPGLIGTRVPLSAPGRGNAHPNPAAGTAVPTAARSSGSDGPLSPVAPRRDLTRDDRSWNDRGLNDRGWNDDASGPATAFSGDNDFEDVGRTSGSDGSGLVEGLVGGVLN